MDMCCTEFKNLFLVVVTPESKALVAEVVKAEWNNQRP